MSRHHSDDERLPDSAPAAEVIRPRTRRALLAGLLGGAGALVAGAVGRVNPIRAVVANPVLMDVNNDAGTGNTSLTTSSTGTALLVTQNGSGTALRGSAVGAGSIAGFFTAQNGTGISGVTGNPGSYGVFGQNNGAAGSAGAMRADGKNNHGLVATTANADTAAVRAVSSAATSGAGAAIVAEGGANIAIQATASAADAVAADISNTGGIAVQGVTDAAVGVKGVATDSGQGVHVESAYGSGVSGVSAFEFGVHGSSAASTGVVGETGALIVTGCRPATLHPQPDKGPRSRPRVASPPASSPVPTVQRRLASMRRTRRPMEWRSWQRTRPAPAARAQDQEFGHFPAARLPPTSTPTTRCQTRLASLQDRSA
jgi:hypothetical protein